MPKLAKLTVLVVVVAVSVAVAARDGVAADGKTSGTKSPGTPPADHDAVIEKLKRLCGPKEEPGPTTQINAAARSERVCLERSLARQIERARSNAPSADRSLVATLGAQQGTWNKLTEVVCNLEEELFWLQLSHRWRSDGTMRGLTYSGCVMRALREQNYFWQTLGRGDVADMRETANEIASHASYARGVLSDLASATTVLLARKMPPGRREHNFGGAPLGPEDLLKLAASIRRARDLADALGPRTCASWKSLTAAFSSEGECSETMRGYYVALTGLLDGNDKPIGPIELEEQTR